MAPTKNSNKGGGAKGFFTRAATSFQQGFQFSRECAYWLAQKGGRIGLVLASTSMVVLMPLIFEINREITVRQLSAVTKKCHLSLKKAGCFVHGSGAVVSVRILVGNLASRFLTLI